MISPSPSLPLPLPPLPPLNPSQTRSLTQSIQANSRTRSTNPSSKPLYSLATLVRLLLDLSEHIWRSLEREDFLSAARYESLGRIISNELTSGSWDETGQTKPTEVVEMFPIVERQSETLSQLAPQISSRAKTFLRKWETTPQATLQALAAIVLLDNTNLLDSLHLFLLVRKSTLTTLINRLGGTWIDQVKNSVKLLLVTLTHVQHIFLDHEFIEFLKAIQDGSSKEKHLKPLLSLLPNAHQLMRHIPRSIVDFCPFVAALAESSDPFQPHSITIKWFDECQSELISYINRKLDQLRSTQSLVEFRQKLHLVILDQPSGQFTSTIQSFESQLIDCLHKRFFELYRSRLDQLKHQIIETFNPPALDPPQDSSTTTPSLDPIKNDGVKSWLFDTKLPSLESNDSSKLTKYLASIQSRIEGKQIMEEKGTDRRKDHQAHPSSLVRKMEAAGKLLRQDFYSWNVTRGSRPLDIQQNDPKAVYVDLGAQFVNDCFLAIKQVLSQEMEKPDLGRELNIGDLALQMLATRNSFMVDLSLSRDSRPEGREHDLIQTFQLGLNQIILDSSTHWSQSVVDRSVQIFKSKVQSTLVEKLHYFDLTSAMSDQPKRIVRPSDAIFESLNFISRSLVRSLGVHRLKAQQVDLLDRLINPFIVGVLDDPSFQSVEQQPSSSQEDHQRFWVLDSILFDLLFLIEFFSPSHLDPEAQKSLKSILSSDNVDRIQSLIRSILRSTGEREGTVDHQSSSLEEVKRSVRRFKSSIVRLWWPLVLIKQESDGELEKSDGDDKPREKSSRTDYHPSFNNSSAPAVPKLPKLGGLRLVKPGNRFGLLSVY